MGRLQASEFAHLVAEGSLDLSAALTWHLGSNHYPPVLFMQDAASEAIEAFNDFDYEREINMPAGVRYQGSDSAPASALVRELHLESFIEADALF